MSPSQLQHIILLSLLLFSCSKNVNIAKNFQPRQSYIGKWHWGGSFYSSYLVIRQDGTFMFIERGCTGSRFTEGNWLDNTSGVLLTSYQKFQDSVGNYLNDHSEIISIRPTGSTKGAKWIYQPGNFIVKSTFTFGPGDTSFAYFDKALLTLKSDTLLLITGDTSSKIRKYVAK